jgi:hypothetical protein
MNEAIRRIKAVDRLNEGLVTVTESGGHFRVKFTRGGAPPHLRLAELPPPAALGGLPQLADFRSSGGSTLEWQPSPIVGTTSHSGPPHIMILGIRNKPAFNWLGHNSKQRATTDVLETGATVLSPRFISDWYRWWAAVLVGLCRAQHGCR